MEDLPKIIPFPNRLAPDIHRMVKQVETVTLRLAEISKSEGIDVDVLAKIWAALPLEENGGITYLEVASQCILEISAAVDQVCVDRPYQQKIFKKYKLAARLLDLKADQLELAA